MFKRKLIQRKTTGASVCLMVSILFVLILTTPSAAQDYPNKPITIYVGFAAGGSVGMSAQIFADNAKKYLPKSQPVLVNFKTGAGSATAADYVLTQPADGYTLYWYAADLSVKLAKDGSQLKFTKDDFIPIGTISETPLIVPVNKESPFKTLEDFIDYARKNPGKLSYGSSGIGATPHTVGEIFQDRAGIKLNHVPFAGGTPAITAVLGKHVDTYFGSPTGPMLENLQPGGGLRLLAIFARERLQAFPEVPTCLERGVNVVFGSWNALAAPKGTPSQVVDILQKVFTKTAEDPEVKKAISTMGYKPVNWGPQETRKEMDRYYQEPREIFLKLGLTK